MKIKTIHESLREDYKSGKLTLEQVAEELHRAGWTNYIDTDYAKSIVEK